VNAQLQSPVYYFPMWVAPQQEPGPAQPASAGRLPQQPWSLGPGVRLRLLPLSGLDGDISFSGSAAPQAGHAIGASADSTNNSPW
jgi:hypothetical protein